ncbi:MAG: endonuclease/exonuclease/phosphatase family protein [Candidatus Nitricoxidivorans perseverans]|uniref:Endonuclease/exonuclease/phosphatase family protein n=1 Tax=Candidatus Nitricoxidivorans perseverans TaxID=2975601 RepID=A0AA49FJG2_9PROT|nr:MAG: endonuclease/exonuclease/phosphatase family protein [Candidatus Nitricoxidivorans perseverans]
MDDNPGVSSPVLHIATYNIHKGFSQFNRRMVVHELRERLRELDPDIAFLQEVQGLHLGHAEAHEDWPEEPQHEFLAAEVWQSTAYGRNVIYEHGHHGNAILSRLPILASHNQDVTHLRFERRGLLHCAVDVPGMARQLHCVCAHLSLFGRSRRRQIDALATRLETIVPAGAPLIVAGDFNDWRNSAHDLLAERMGLIEVFAGIKGRPPRSYPSALPVLRLDRIYVRGFHIETAQVLFGPPWSEISDHAALSATLIPE